MVLVRKRQEEAAFTPSWALGRPDRDDQATVCDGRALALSWPDQDDNADLVA